MVLSRKTREKASVTVRKISGGFEISIMVRGNLMDLFISERPVAFDRLKSEGKLTIKVPEQLCSISIRDTTEKSITDVLEIFSCSHPPDVGKKNLGETVDFTDNKENIPQHSPKNTLTKQSMKSSHTPDKFTPPTIATTGISKLKSPTKRLIAFGTGTPSKITDGRCALSSPHNLRSSLYMLSSCISCPFHYKLSKRISHTSLM